MAKPKIVIVSGAPGAGKTVLAKKLAEGLDYDFLDSDEFLEEMYRANRQNQQYDREKVGMPAYFAHLRSLAENGTKVVTDAVLRRARDTKHVQELAEVSKLLIVHCLAENTAERFYKRELNSDGTEPDWLGPHMEEIRRDRHLDAEPLDLGLPLIEVDTNDGYEPSVETIIAKIKKL